MINRYPGKCACGTWVDAEEGVAFKADGKWAVRCSYCEEHPPEAAPKREMLGAVMWPNGLGFTECTLEYEDAVNAARDAREAVQTFEETYDPRDPDERQKFNDLDHAAYKAENALGMLQLEGGHLGERITYDKPDPWSALLAGGKVNITPGGGMTVAQL